jgi:glucose 1-dehydrogenase
MAASATGNAPLRGQIAVVSGGLGDIGRATAHALSAAGATVALSDLPPAAAARRAMPGYHYTRVDVTKTPAVEGWLARVTRDLGPPSLVICNAGIVEFGSALDTTPAAWRRTLDVNLSGAFFMAQAAARAMVKKKRKGRIVFVGSWAGHVPHTGITTYSVAKAGLRMAMKCLALELAPKGVCVNEIAPGVVDAGLSGKLMARRMADRTRIQRKIPLGQLLTANDVARGVISLCDPQNAHMTGAVLLLDGGLSLTGPL